jgi:hypothetical protein
MVGPTAQASARRDRARVHQHEDDLRHVTVAELSFESFFPADPQRAQAMHDLELVS